MIQLSDVCGCSESGGETHLEITLEVPEHWYEDEELVDAPEDPPSGEVLE
jgi:hypothetical protein